MLRPHIRDLDSFCLCAAKLGPHPPRPGCSTASHIRIPSKRVEKEVEERAQPARPLSSGTLPDALSVLLLHPTAGTWPQEHTCPQEELQNVFVLNRHMPAIDFIEKRRKQIFRRASA